MRQRGNSEALDHVEDEHIPGTEVMRDHDGLHFQRAHGGKGQVLIPQPTNRLDDPLNWQLKWKIIVAITQALYVLFTVGSALSMAPMNGLAAKEWPNESEERIGLLTGICVLSLGYANFIIVPCSNIFGRRITALVTSVFVIGFAIWEALAKSYTNFLVSRFMTGIPTAINETMMVQVIADVFFLHERGRWMGLYFTAFFMGLFIGPIMSGNMAERYGWRTFWWLSVALGVFNTINLLVGFPETRYAREAIVKEEAEARDARINKAGNNGTPGEGAEPSFEEKHEVEHTHDAEIGEIGSAYGRGSPSKQQWKLWQPINPNWRQTLFKDLVSPWFKFFNPIILWAGMTTYGAANVLLFFNLTESTLAQEPWNFSPSSIGYANFALVVGGIIGLSTAGTFSDWVAKKMTQRNNGVREAEFRLPSLIPYIAIAIVSITVGGMGFERKWDWPVILCVGYAGTGIIVTSLPTIAVAYAVDCYTPIAGDIMVVATVIKNTTGFGMSYWVFSLIAKKGIFVCAMAQFATCVGPACFALPIYIWGKNIRRMTKNSSWHRE